MIKTCPICGKQFETDTKRKYCSFLCADTAQQARSAKYSRSAQRHEYDREYREKRKAMKHRKRESATLVEKAVKAREMGMSYGKYCLWLESQEGAKK